MNCPRCGGDCMALRWGSGPRIWSCVSCVWTEDDEDGSVAQLVRHSPLKRDIEGSTPSRFTK